MKHIKDYKVFEGMGDDILDHKSITLIEDLMLEIRDMGFEVTIRAYEAYVTDVAHFDIFVQGESKLFGADNIDELEKIQKNMKLLNEFSEAMIDIIKRISENGLELDHFLIDTIGDGGKFYSFTKFKIEYKHTYDDGEKEGDFEAEDELIGDEPDDYVDDFERDNEHLRDEDF